VVRGRRTDHSNTHNQHQPLNCDFHKLLDHFNISGILTIRTRVQWDEIPKIVSCDRNWHRVCDFSTLGVEKQRRKSFGSESLKSRKVWRDRWQGSVSETEDNREDRWCTCC